MVVAVGIGLLVAFLLGSVLFLKKRNKSTAEGHHEALLPERKISALPARRSGFNVDSVQKILPDEFKALLKRPHQNGLSFYIIRLPYNNVVPKGPFILHVLYIGRNRDGEVLVAPLPMNGVNLRRITGIFSLRGWLPIRFTGTDTFVNTIDQGTYKQLIKNLVPGITFFGDEIPKQTILTIKQEQKEHPDATS